LYEWFEVDENFVDVVRPMYSRMSPLSTRYIVPIRMRSAAKERLIASDYKLTKSTTKAPRRQKGKVVAGGVDAEKEALPVDVPEVDDCHSIVQSYF
jgi:hypothetical protein